MYTRKNILQDTSACKSEIEGDLYIASVHAHFKYQPYLTPVQLSIAEILEIALDSHGTNDPILIQIFTLGETELPDGHKAGKGRRE
jgi:hypothetical protein